MRKLGMLKLAALGAGLLLAVAGAPARAMSTYDCMNAFSRCFDICGYRPGAVTNSCRNACFADLKQCVNCVITRKGDEGCWVVAPPTELQSPRPPKKFRIPGPGLLEAPPTFAPQAPAPTGTPLRPPRSNPLR